MVAAEVATYSGGNTEVILIVAPSLVVKPKATVVLRESAWFNQRLRRIQRLLSSKILQRRRGTGADRVCCWLLNFEGAEPRP